jgi:hypothetical protein
MYTFRKYTWGEASGTLAFVFSVCGVLLLVGRSFTGGGILLALGLLATLAWCKLRD